MTFLSSAKNNLQDYAIMKTLRYITLLLLAFSATWSSAKSEWENWGAKNNQKIGFIVRAGYTVGGTTPLPLPSEMRAIREFSPKGGATVGVDGYKMLSKRWGVGLGLHFFYEGFHTAAEVKSYHMSLVKDQTSISGYFTGTDVTNTTMMGLTIPVLATYRLSPRWNINVGPYFSTYFTRTFDGEVYEDSEGRGYIRKDTPTGEKIIIDHTNPATYEFNDDMRRVSGGVELGVDWKAYKAFNVFAKVDWGLANIWKSDFDAITFSMYPVYATLGVAYRY